MDTDNKNKNLNVPHLRFPEFSGEWKAETIADACTLYNGRAYKQEELLPIGKYRVLRVGNFFTNDSWYYSNLELDEQKTIVKGDLLYAWSASFGPRFWTGEKAIYHYHIWKVIPKEHIDKDYLYHFLYKDSLIIKSRTQGGTMVHVTKGDMEKRPMQFPCLEEQRKIAKLLSLLNERIATQNKIIEKLQSLIKGLVDEIITPQCGQIVTFDKLYSKAGEGGTPSTLNAEYYENGNIPFVKIDDLNNKYLLTNKDYITELGLQKSSAWLIPANSIIYSNGATIGAISINEYPICTKQGILGIVPNSCVDVEYLYYLMCSSYFQKEVERIVTEGTMKTAYLKDINHIKCPKPNWNRQKEISQTLSTLSLKEDIERQLLKKYQMQKQCLLRQMFI